MTYKEWIEATKPKARLHGSVEKMQLATEVLGGMYRKYVEDTTGMDPVDYFHMRNDKGFSSWLRNTRCQRSVGKMKDTYRNRFILWAIYKKKVKARLAKFIDDEGFMRDIEQPREIYYGEAIKINPEMYDQLSKRILGREAYVQDEDWASGFLHDPKRFGKAIEEFDPIRQWEKTKKAAEQIRSQFDPVSKPKHYTDGKIEVIDFIEDKKLGFHLGNTVKYIARAGKKDPSKEIEDLEKAKWYLERRIKQLCHTQEKSGSSC